MADDDQTLQHYGAVTGCNIHVIDNEPSQLIQDFDDVSQVPKYVISEEKYAERTDSFRKFKQQMMANNPNFMQASKIGPE